MNNILRQANGKPWLTDENKTVPAKCPICGEDVGLFLMGEPVFLCKGNNVTKDEAIETIRRF